MLEASVFGHGETAMKQMPIVTEIDENGVRTRRLSLSKTSRSSGLIADDARRQSLSAQGVTRGYAETEVQEVSTGRSARSLPLNAVVAACLLARKYPGTTSGRRRLCQDCFMKRPFSATVWREGDWFVSQCLDVDVASQGRTEEEALENLREALELHFEPPVATHFPAVRQIEAEVGAA